MNWNQLAQENFGMSVKDSRRLKTISRVLHRFDMVAMNERSLSQEELKEVSSLVAEVGLIFGKYGDVQYEFPDPRSGSGLRVILPSGHMNSLGGYNI